MLFGCALNSLYAPGSTSARSLLNSRHAQAASLGSSYGPTWATVWFKIEAEIPAAWRGEEVHLVWDSNSEAMLWSADGCPLQGLYGTGGAPAIPAPCALPLRYRLILCLV